MSATRHALYARTAAGGPAAVEAQLVALQAEIALGGDDATVTVWSDVDTSGAGTPGPGLTALLDEVERGVIDVVLVTALDRLGRSSQTVAEILARARSAGAAVLIAEVAR